MRLAALLVAATCLTACDGRGSLPATAPSAPGAPGAPSSSPVPAATPSLTLYSVPSGINHLTLSTDGKIWFTTNDQNTPAAQSSVGFLDPSTGRATTFSAIAENESPYSVPDQITAGANGSVWFDVNWFGFGCPQPCTPASPMINEVTETGTLTAYATGMPSGSSVYDLIRAADSHVYALGSMPASGQSSAQPAVLQFTLGQTVAPSATAAGPAVQGNPYITLNQGLNGALVIATSGALYNFSSGSFSNIGSTANGGYCGVVSSGGAYWISQSFFTPTANGNGETGAWASNIVRMTSAGVATNYAMPSSGVVTCSLNGEGQDQVVSSPGGNIYYTENNADKIGRLNTVTGASTELSPGIGPTVAVTVDASGNVWVAGINGKIAEIKGF